MASCIEGYDEFCRRYFLTDYKGTPGTGSVSVEVVSGIDPADETLSQRLERIFYFSASQEEYKGKQHISFYIHFGGVESLPNISTDNLMISRHINRLTIGDIPIDIRDFDEDLKLSEGRSRISLLTPDEIEGLNSLTSGEYPAKLILEGTIYKAGNPDEPIERWRIEFQDEVELDDLAWETVDNTPKRP
jgi:hypothetical protein